MISTWIAAGCRRLRPHRCKRVKMHANVTAIRLACARREQISYKLVFTMVFKPFQSASSPGPLNMPEKG